jgi:riboflavin-specific deaminase-like protein
MTADWAEAAYADLVRRRADGRPWVAVNMVASADGAISVQGRTKALGSPSDHHLFHYLRSLADVILVGAQTVRAEGYGPARVSEERRAARVARGQQQWPRIAVVTRSLDLDLNRPMFTEPTARPLIVVPASADPSRLRAAAEVADVIVAGERGVDMADALGQLGTLGAGFVLCEGGPTINGELARDDLIDELLLTIAPALVGGSAQGVLGGGMLPDLLELELVHGLRRDGDLFLRYRRTGREELASAPAAEAVEPFEAAVADLDYPMVVVTAAADGERGGCLVGFTSQASINPRRYVVWVSKANRTFSLASRTDTLAVHFLSKADRALAELFGGETGDELDKFARCGWHEGPGGVPVLDGVARWFAGRVVDRLDTGDHVAHVLAPIEGESGEWPGQLGFQDVRGISPGHPA